PNSPGQSFVNVSSDTSRVCPPASSVALSSFSPTRMTETVLPPSSRKVMKPGLSRFFSVDSVLANLKQRTCWRAAAAHGSPASTLTFHSGASSRHAAFSSRPSVFSCVLSSATVSTSGADAAVAALAAACASAADEAVDVADAAFAGVLAAAEAAAARGAAGSASHAADVGADAPRLWAVPAADIAAAALGAADAADATVAAGFAARVAEAAPSGAAK